ncbi:hypothetical protein CLU79DRAFT_771158 [Phycomyces nitens]|nr:hypothetical protein CLU79DRAFT_771158 [Phycomyces nitens]
MLSVTAKEAKTTQSADTLIQAIKYIKAISSKSMCNTLYANRYKQDHNAIGDYSVELAESLVKHL